MRFVIRQKEARDGQGLPGAYLHPHLFRRPLVAVAPVPALGDDPPRLSDPLLKARYPGGPSEALLDLEELPGLLLVERAIASDVVVVAGNLDPVPKPGYVHHRSPAQRIVSGSIYFGISGRHGVRGTNIRFFHQLHLREASGNQQRPEDIPAHWTVWSIIDVLAEAKPYLRERYNVREIGIFGSYARGEQGPESDVDILVELDEPIGWDVVDKKEDLERMLGLPVDLAIKGEVARRPQLMRAVEAETVYV